MKTRQSRRQTAKVPHCRWLAYATASAAATLAGSNSSEAGIHYSGRLQVRFPPHKDIIMWFQLDQPGDSFTLNHFAETFSGGALFGITGIASAGFRGYFFFKSSFVSKLCFAQKIRTGYFEGSSYLGNLETFLGQYGQWGDPGVGFVGFRFNSGNGRQYGWVRLKMLGNSRNNGFLLMDYAYADPGELIRAGDGIPCGEDGQDMSDEQGPDEGSLGGLALGAVGLLAWRKSRSRSKN